MKDLVLRMIVSVKKPKESLSDAAKTSRDEREMQRERGGGELFCFDPVATTDI